MTDPDARMVADVLAASDRPMTTDLLVSGSGVIWGCCTTGPSRLGRYDRAVDQHEIPAALSSIGGVVRESSVQIAQSWRRAAVAMAETSRSLGLLRAELEHGYQQYVATRSEIRSRHPRPRRLRRDDESRPIGRVLSVEERRGGRR
jgi:hypothetical protein